MVKWNLCVCLWADERQKALLLSFCYYEWSVSYLSHDFKHLLVSVRHNLFSKPVNVCGSLFMSISCLYLACVCTGSTVTAWRCWTPSFCGGLHSLFASLEVRKHWNETMSCGKIISWKEKKQSCVQIFRWVMFGVFMETICKILQIWHLPNFNSNSINIKRNICHAKLSLQNGLK